MKPKLKLVKFPKTKINDTTNFIPTLVWVLEQARLGKIRGYSVVYIVDDGDNERVIEASNLLDKKRNRCQLLGAMRRAETNFIKRAWEDEGD